MWWCVFPFCSVFVLACWQYAEGREDGSVAGLESEWVGGWLGGEELSHCSAVFSHQ